MGHDNLRDDLCPCGSGNLYLTCCQPYLVGEHHLPSPEELMRSRYSAFCKGDVDYLLATHHPSKRQVGDRQTLAKTIAETTWLGLRVLNSNTQLYCGCDKNRSLPSVMTQASNSGFHTEQSITGTGSVEFVAFFQSQGIPSQLHEKSEFIRQNERWYYLQGTLLGPITTGRNDACWCGSGKKYKKCHGA